MHDQPPVDPPPPDQPVPDQPDRNQFNPYQATVESELSDGQPTAAMVPGMIREMSRWQTFIAVLLTLMLVLMIGVFAYASIGEDPAGAIGGLACGFGVSVLVYGLPAVMLWRAASAARTYASHPNAARLTEFTAGQLNFWRTIGVLIVIVTGFYAVVMVFALIGFSAF